MEVSVRDLKDQLSEYLRRAEAGEEILVTSYGQAVVRMTGVEQTPTEETEADVIARLRADPRVRAGSGGRVQPGLCPILATPTGGALLSELSSYQKLNEERKEILAAFYHSKRAYAV